MKKVVILIGIIACIPFFVLKILKSPNSAKVLVKNQSKQIISELDISLYRYPQKNTAKGIKPGESVRFSFSDFSDTHYVIKGNLTDGNQIDEEAGYLTHGMNFNDVIIIKEKGKVEVINE